MCGSFTCSKNSLILLNIFYMVVAIILMAVAGAAKYASIVTSLKIVSGIIACGVFLLMISIVGIAAASKHHQVLLFFYMVVLFLIFVIQFAVACACLAINPEQQQVFAREGWRLSPENMKAQAQIVYHCCGYDNVTTTDAGMGHPSCTEVTNVDGQSCCPLGTSAVDCCETSQCLCPRCRVPLTEAIGGGFSAVGGVGLFFSFTEILGVTIAWKYRHQMDPRANIQSLLQRN